MFYRQGLKGGICKSSGIGCFRFLNFCALRASSLRTMRPAFS